MKKSLLFVLLLSPLALLAQETYKAFLEDGKAWNYRYHNTATGEEYTYRLFVNGDTIINGATCKKICQDTPASFKYALLEEDRAVYMMEQDGTKRLLYDFGKQPGETIARHEYDDNYSETLMVKAIDTIKVELQYFRRFHVAVVCNDANTGTTAEHEGVWVEGIGGESDMDCQYVLPGNNISFVSCSLGQDTIISGEDFWSEPISIAGVASPVMEGFHDGTAYDLQGRRSQGARQHGIIIRNGKKVVVK